MSACSVFWLVLSILHFLSSSVATPPIFLRPYVLLPFHAIYWNAQWNNLSILKSLSLTFSFDAAIRWTVVWRLHFSFFTVSNSASKRNKMFMLIVYAVVNWVARVFSQPQEYLYVIENLKIRMWHNGPQKITALKSDVWNYSL